MDQDLIALKLGAIRRIPGNLAVRLKKAVGFRNLAVHGYEAINWDIVHAISTRHLRDFTDFARAVATLPEPR